MNVGSLFSGIGGLDKGLHDAGHRHVFFCESDGWRRDVLAARWPGVPIYDDVRNVGRTGVEPGGDAAAQDLRLSAGGTAAVSGAGPRPRSADGADVRAVGEPAGRTAADGASAPADDGRRQAGAGLLGSGDVELLCGGFPCQDLSVAGQRRGLAGSRSGLFHEFARVIDAVRPGWILVENVPGLLSSNGGRDFGIVLGTLADLGYGVAWRILDSRYFGVPQRRRRVFILGALVDGDPATAAERAGQVLAVGTRCPRHPPTGTETGPDVAYALADGSGNRTGSGRDGQDTLIAHALTSEGADASEDGTGRGTPLVAAPLVSRSSRGNAQTNSPGHNADDVVVVAAPLTKGSATGDGVNQPGRRQEDDVNLVAFHPTGGGAKGLSVGALAPGIGFGNGGQVAIGTLREHVRPGSNTDHSIAQGAGVRRLTPVECERLQALPDGWTDLGGTPDSRRYSALGDAVTASVGYWIGCRL